MSGAERRQRRKRHHYLAQSYMKPWVNADGRVAARRRLQAAHHTPNLINVAVESDLYTVDGAVGPDDSIEVALSDSVDDRIGDILAGLRTGPTPRKGSAEREQVSRLLAIQMVRTPDHVGRMMFPNIVADFCGEQPVSREGMRRYLAEVHLEAEPDEAEVEGALTYVNGVLAMGPNTKAEAFDILFRVALEELAPALGNMAWAVETCNHAAFITTDLPLCVWRRRPNRFDRMGTGLGSADEVRFPWDRITCSC